MNTDTIDGNARNLAGTAKETVGRALGDDNLREQGLIDQAGGKAREMFGDAKDAAAPAVDKVRTVAKQRPWAAALAAGVIGMAVLGTLKGRSKA